jgi:diguanylate cyclase (GGDEF)-like protein
MSQKPHTPLSARSLIAIAVLGMMALGGGIYFGVNYAVERAVVADAVDRAQHWTQYFLNAMPELDRLLADGELTAAQSEVIKTAQTVGNVYRFKLYNPTARQVLVSDDEAEADEDEDAESPDHNDTAAAVLASHEPSIELHDDADPGQPPLFVEAYVPIVDAAGTTHGVVEVYIDQTRTAALLRTTFATLAIGLGVIAALAFGLPTLAFLLRSRQVSEARGRADFLAQYDAMTGLLNRAAVTERLQKALRFAKVDRGRLAVAVFDIDEFKSINDMRGTAAGDALLKHVAHAIEAPLGPRDFCGRLAGDQFVAVLNGRSDAALTGFVEAVLRAAREPITIDGHVIAGRLSAGFHTLERGATTSEALHRADAALFQAKSDGGNGWRLFSPEMEASMVARRELEQRLRDATSAKSFELFFQPLVKAANRQCEGFEALLRLPDGSGGYIPPATFIPVAESMGLINEIGAWVLGEATRVAASWPPDLFVAVNLSVRQFADGRLLDEVTGALSSSGLRPAQLELEVTESMLIDNTEMVGAQLRAIKALGVSIAMDDFGTGYSSLGYLWQFGFDKLKIDRSFIVALEADEARARDILDTVISLGHKLDMTVTAEGVETERQARVLASLAVDTFQGYLYGRPAPVADIAGYLLRNRVTPAGSTSDTAARAAG